MEYKGRELLTTELNLTEGNIYWFHKINNGHFDKVKC